MKARAPRRRGAAARRQDAGDDLRQAVDPHARLVRRRHAPARRRDHRADRPGNAARPRRDHRRHRARAVALCRCHHDPHPRARHAARARAVRHRAGDQRADAALASLPDHGRRHDLRGARGPDPRPQGGVDRRRQQRAHLVDARRAAVRVRARGRDAAGARAEAQAAGLGQVRRAPTIEIGHDPEAAVEGRRLRRHRHLGVDGRQGRRAPAQSAAALPGQRAPDGKGETRAPYSCIACRPIAARRSPTR